jgi:hypothetical protein
MPRLPALTVQQVLLVLAAASVSSVGSADSGSCALLDVKRGGAVIGTTSLTGVKGTTAAACCAACDANPQCIAFTLSITSDTDSICWLKSNAKNSSICQHPSCISGTNDQAAPATAAVPELCHQRQLPESAMHMGGRPLQPSATSATPTQTMQLRQFV